jgi:hypothetical protein
MIHNKLINSLIMTLVMFSLSLSVPVYSEDYNARSVKSLDGEKPLDGELLLPDDYNGAEDKKCLTVCDRWGEDCILNPRTGSRKCRRVCKSFAEECF